MTARQLYSLIEADLYLKKEVRRELDFTKDSLQGTNRPTGECIYYNADIAPRNAMTVKVYRGSARRVRPTLVF